MADLISRAAAIAEIEEYIEEYSELEPETGYHNLKWCAMEEAKDVLSMLPAVDAVPVEYLMKYAQLPTEFAIAAWRKQDKDAQEKQIKRLDKPMSFDDALNLVNEVFPLGKKEQEART